MPALTYQGVIYLKSTGIVQRVRPFRFDGSGKMEQVNLTADQVVVILTPDQIGKVKEGMKTTDSGKTFVAA